MDRGRHRWRGVAFAVAPVPVRRQRHVGERPSTAGHCRSVPVGRVSSSVRPLSSVMRLRRSRGDRRSHRSSSRQTNSMCGCCVGDLEFVAGGVRVTVRHSKVDQEGHDAVVGVPNGEPPDTSRCAGCSAPTRRTRPTPASRHEGGGGVDVTEQLLTAPELTAERRDTPPRPARPRRERRIAAALAHALFFLRHRAAVPSPSPERGAGQRRAVQDQDPNSWLRDQRSKSRLLNAGRAGRRAATRVLLGGTRG